MNKDREIWAAFLFGSQDALGDIFIRYYNRLFLYGMSLAGCKHEVEDAIQELFLTLWKQRGKIDKAWSVEYYLLHSFRRILFRQKQKKSSLKRINTEYSRENMGFLSSIEEKIIQQEHEKEREEIYLQVRQKLTDRQQEVLYLRLQHGMTNKEIASILDVSVQRVKNYIYEGTKKMREEVERAILR